jgi:hypothetical protein
VPHIVPSTNAGAVFHPLPLASMLGLAGGAGDRAAPVLVRALPGSGTDLQLLRSRPDLLCGWLCARGATPRSAGGRPALSGEPPRAGEPCRACRPLSRAAKERDASGFPTAVR